MNCSKKTIAITGVASGIGAQTARVLRNKGAHIIGFDRNKPTDPVDQFIQYDQSDEKSIATAVTEIKGNIDVLCNIAGVAPTAGAVKVLEINFLGLRHLTQLILGKIKDQGLIINVSSMAGFFWQKNLPLINALIGLDKISDAAAFCAKNSIIDGGMDPNSSYPLAKQTLTFWSLHQVALLAERGIRTNIVSPGPVDTPILKDFVATIGELPQEGFLARLRPGKPHEIADVIGFLCEDEASWINGVNIPVDGGLSAFLTTSGL